MTSPAYERVFGFRAGDPLDRGTAHRAVWRTMSTVHAARRDFLFAIAARGTTRLVKVRSAAPRPGWNEATLAERFHGVIQVALEARTHSPGGTVHARPVPPAGATDLIARHLQSSGIECHGLQVTPVGRAIVDGRPRWDIFDAVFDGEVRDRAAADGLFLRGIGRGKAYGFGMLVAQP